MCKQSLCWFGRGRGLEISVNHPSALSIFYVSGWRAPLRVVLRVNMQILALYPNLMGVGYFAEKVNVLIEGSSRRERKPSSLKGVTKVGALWKKDGIWVVCLR